MVPEKFIQFSTLFEMAVKKLENSIIPYYEGQKFSFYQLAFERPYDIALRCLLEFVGHEIFLLSNGEEPIRVDPKIFKENRYRDDIGQLYVPQKNTDDWSDQLKFQIPVHLVNNRMISSGVSPDQIDRFSRCDDGYTKEYRSKFFRSELARGAFSTPNLFIKQPDFIFDFELYDYLSKHSSGEARLQYCNGSIEENYETLRKYQGSLICTTAQQFDEKWEDFWKEALDDPYLMQEFPIEFIYSDLNQKDATDHAASNRRRSSTRKRDIVADKYYELGYEDGNQKGKTWDEIYNEINAEVDFAFNIRTLRYGLADRKK